MNEMQNMVDTIMNRQTNTLTINNDGERVPRVSYEPKIQPQLEIPNDYIMKV